MFDKKEEVLSMRFVESSKQAPAVVLELEKQLEVVQFALDIYRANVKRLADVPAHEKLKAKRRKLYSMPVLKPLTDPELNPFGLNIYNPNPNMKQQLSGDKDLGLKNLMRITGMLMSRAAVQCDTQVQEDCSNAATQHSSSGAAPAFISIDMTGVLSHQAGGADDDSTMTMNNEAHAQVADSNDGPPTPPIRIEMHEDPADETDAANPSNKAKKMLFTMGFGTLTMCVATALYKPPRGVVFGRCKPAYYGTLAVISVCGMAEVAVALCVSRCRRFVRVVLCTSITPFATVVALGGFSVVMKG